MSVVITVFDYYAVLITMALECSFILGREFPPTLFFLRIAVAMWGLFGSI